MRSLRELAEKIDIRVITEVVANFNLGPSPHHVFKALVQQIAMSFQVSLLVVFDQQPWLHQI